MEIPTLDDQHRLENKVDRLTTLLETLLTTNGAPPIDAKEIARRVGLTSRAVYHHDYRHYLPNFGVSDFPDGRVRWKLETYVKWISIPDAERKAMWINMPAREREKIVIRKKPALKTA